MSVSIVCSRCLLYDVNTVIDFAYRSALRQFVNVLVIINILVRYSKTSNLAIGGCTYAVPKRKLRLPADKMS